MQSLSWMLRTWKDRSTLLPTKWNSTFFFWTLFLILVWSRNRSTKPTGWSNIWVYYRSIFHIRLLVILVLQTVGNRYSKQMGRHEMVSLKRLPVIGGTSYTYSEYHDSTVATETIAINISFRTERYQYDFVDDVASSSNQWKPYECDIDYADHSVTMSLYTITAPGELTIDDTKSFASSGNVVVNRRNLYVFRGSSSSWNKAVMKSDHTRRHIHRFQHWLPKYSQWNWRLKARSRSMREFLR